MNITTIITVLGWIIGGAFLAVSAAFMIGNMFKGFTLGGDLEALQYRVEKLEADVKKLKAKETSK